MVITLLIIEDEPLFKKMLENNINIFMSARYECCFSAQVKRVSVLTGTIELEHVYVQSKEKNDWLWSCERLLWSSAFVDIIARHSLPVGLKLYSFKAYSRVHNAAIAIVPHFLSFIRRNNNSFAPDVNSLVIYNGSVHLADEHGYECRATIRNDIHFFDGQIQTKCIVSNGSFMRHELSLLENIHGRCEGTFSLEQLIEHSSFSSKLEGMMVSNGVPIVPISLTIGAAAGHGTLDLCLSEYKATCKAFVHNSLLNIDGKLPLGVVASLLLQKDITCGGMINVLMSGVDYASWDADISVRDVQYKGYYFPGIDVKICQKEDECKGIYTIMHAQDSLPLAHGHILWPSHKQQGAVQQSAVACTLHHALPLVGGWSIADGTLHGSLGEEGNKISYACTLSKEGRDNRHVDGTIRIDNGALMSSGTSGDFHYTMLLERLPYWHIKDIICSVKESTLLALHQAGDSFHGTSSYAILRLLLQEMGIDFPGEGIIKINGAFLEQGISCSLAMDNAHIKLPYSYNVVRGFSASCLLNAQDKCIITDNVRILLHEGEMVCSKATFLFDSSYKISYGFIPLLFKNCFVSWKKEFFALVSGGVTLRYRHDTVPTIEGMLLFDRSHVRGNILSSEFQQNLFTEAVHPLYGSWADTTCAVMIATRKPAHVKTSFLDATVRLEMAIRGTLARPELSWSVNFVHGFFEFPYQPLYINSGTIYFLPGHLNDPDPGIELFARNTIKRYSIGMRVGGSIKHPKIMFESSPTLAEEQIITLLLGGSEDGSLYTVMQTALMHSIETLLFGPAETSSGLQRYLKNLFKPLKNVRIVPHFSDTTGRNGLRGSIAIEVNERLRGLVQKNFSLPEDTRVEVEYSLSDDTIIRAVKDERGDAGGEIETRWKL